MLSARIDPSPKQPSGSRLQKTPFSRTQAQGRKMVIIIMIRAFSPGTEPSMGWSASTAVAFPLPLAS